MLLAQGFVILFHKMLRFFEYKIVSCFFVEYKLYINLKNRNKNYWPFTMYTYITLITVGFQLSKNCPILFQTFRSIVCQPKFITLLSKEENIMMVFFCIIKYIIICRIQKRVLRRISFFIWFLYFIHQLGCKFSVFLPSSGFLYTYPSIYRHAINIICTHDMNRLLFTH